MIRFIISSSIDPYFNLAAEEYFLRETDCEYIFLYQNQPSIIVGKHQNALAEINLSWVLTNNIPVVRRLSGGGTVFHDLGNLNFCFILKGEEGKLADMKGFAQPIIRFLQSFGLDAFLGEKNDIRLPSGKVSGNAEHVYRQRVMHHGTLLYDADLQSLEEAIRVSPSRFIDKAVKSNRSNVINISSHLIKPMSISDFIESLSCFLSAEFRNFQTYLITVEDENRIQELMKSRYQTWEWNYGYSPNFEMKFVLNKTKSGIVSVSKGFVQSISFDDNELNDSLMVDCFTGIKFFPGEFVKHSSTLMAMSFEKALF